MVCSESERKKARVRLGNHAGFSLTKPKRCLSSKSEQTLSSRRDIAAARRVVNNISSKRAVNAAVKPKWHREILALATGPRDGLALLAILRKGARGRHDEEQKGE